MKIIDANTGLEMRVGVPIRNVLGVVTILKLKEGIFSAKALVRVNNQLPAWGDLVVRYTHPGFPLQKILFFPS